jgi:hypothetical protein
MHGFLKVISLSQFSPIHTYSRCTSRAAAEHPQMLVDSARGHFRAHESELFAVRHPHFAARPLRSVAEHPAPPSSLPSKGLVLPRAAKCPSYRRACFPRVSSSLRRSAAAYRTAVPSIFMSASPWWASNCLPWMHALSFTSVDTDRRLAEAVNRLDLTETGNKGLTELIVDTTQGAAKRKTARAIDAVMERLSMNDVARSIQMRRFPADRL